MRKSLGDKRREIPADKHARIIELLKSFDEGEHCRIYPTTHFGYRKITVERPLRLNFQASPERIARLDGEPSFRKLAESKKKDPAAKAAEEAAGRKQQEQIKTMLASLAQTPHTNSDGFVDALRAAEKDSGTKLDATMRKAAMSAVSERDDSADVCADKNGVIAPDPELRDYENVPLSESVEEYLVREVRPYVPDAWIDESVRDSRDGEIGKVGYEINFNRYFYTFTPPRPLEEIEADLKAVESEIFDLLRQVTE